MWPRAVRDHVRACIFLCREVGIGSSRDLLRRHREDNVGTVRPTALKKSMTKDAFIALLAELEAASSAYYDGDGAQLMDDATFDEGLRRLESAARENDWHEADTFLSSVHGRTGDVTHLRPMLSLDKALDDEDMLAFFARVAREVGAAEESVAWSVQPKLDGAAISVQYVDGVLKQISTRGDGVTGEDITKVARHSAGIPSRLAEPCTITVNGECVMTHTDFTEANKEREEHGDRPFANPRNAVSGALRSVHRTYHLPTTFVAYLLAGADGLSDTEQMERLCHLGFTTASQYGPGVVQGSVEALAAISEIEQMRTTLPMDTDGAVIKANDPAIRRKMGEGSRAPRWAIARKFAPDTRETNLLDIVVEVGRTGNLSFTAVLEPVFVGGVTISTTTLHNVSEIERKGLRLPSANGKPQRVVVRRAGEVIPEVVGRANDETDGSEPFVPPTLCPNGHEIDRNSVIWRCVMGRACVIDAGIRYAVSRDCLDIDGMGEKIVAALVRDGVIRDVADIFELTMADLLNVDRLGEANAVKILAGVERAKTLPLGRIIAALGIKGTGRSMSRRIASHFGSMAAFQTATVDELAQVEGIGTVKAPSIAEELKALAPIIARLEASGVALGPTEVSEQAVPQGERKLLKGLTVCVTGAMTGPLSSLSRNEVNELIESLGGKASSSVSARTSFLLTADADSGTGKAKRAAELGIEIVSPEEFAARYLA